MPRGEMELPSFSGSPKGVPSSYTPGVTGKDHRAVQEGDIVEGAKRIGPFATEILQRPPSQAIRPGMKSAAPAPLQASELMKHFKLDSRLEGLTTAQKQKVLDRCLASYKESVSAFETTIGEVAAKHPEAKKFAQEMLRRISLIAKAYQEIQLEGRDELPPVLRELTIRLGSDVEFATYGDGTSVGSIGFNPLAIEKAIEEGTLTLIFMVKINPNFTRVHLQNPLVIRKLCLCCLGFLWKINSHPISGFSLK